VLTEKDILISMGIVDGNIDDGNGLGCECAGIITQVGPDASFQVGDRVAIIGGDSYSTALKTSSALCTKIPDKLSFEDAATMPCVYTTVLHCILDLARIEEGQVRNHTRSNLTVLWLTDDTDCSHPVCLRRHRNCSHSRMSHGRRKGQSPHQRRVANLLTKTDIR
jgi:hypothetical protein